MKADPYPRLLTSYHYYQDQDMRKLHGFYKGPDLFADSGAYSARSKGADVSLVEYAAWLKANPVFTIYANLDVIGNPVATFRNQRKLEQQGLNPLPVFHAGEPWTMLKKYVDNYPYIALGGLVGTQSQRMAWLIKCFKMARATGAVFHGFGVSRWTELRALPWHSTDASSWGSGHRYGVVKLFDPKHIKWIPVRLRDHKTVFANAQLLRYYGVEPKLLADRTIKEKERYTAIVQANAGSVMEAEKYLHRRHGDILHPATKAVGPKCYLADTNLDRPWMANGILGAADIVRPAKVAA